MVAYTLLLDKIKGQNLGTNSLNIFLLEVNFDKSTIGLYLLLISFIFAKFQEN